MNDCAHARMWARTHEVFAEADAARREQLDRWIRAQAEQEAARNQPTREALLDGGLCLRCGTVRLMAKNQTGLCRDCWSGTSRSRREQYRQIHQQRQGRTA